MYELLLLTVQRIDDDRVYLYAMELGYHNILRIVKSIDRQEECLSWAIGKVTIVDNIKEWPLEKNTYITSGDNYAYCDRFISENGRLLRYLTGDGIAYDTVNSEQLMNMLPAEICFYEMGYEIAEMFPFN